ncbi:hypothetical protein [Microbacterium jejuense]|uniref:hypothetical protein n=1 Tax=Microbacterium jejuense TaxID=1263637 RepID=UPI0031E58867
MIAIEDARAAQALDLGIRHSPGDGLYPMSARAVQALKDALDTLIAEHERTVREMHARELHHFETEKLLTEAGIDPDATPPTDDEREALNAVLLRGFTDHANGAGSPLLGVYLADRILAAGFRRQGPITDAQVEAAWQALEEEGVRPLLRIVRAALEAARDAS